MPNTFEKRTSFTDYMQCANSFAKKLEEISGDPQFVEVPGVPDDEMRDLRLRLILEEVEEFFEADEEGDIEWVAKELADILYVVFGTCISYGIDMDKVFYAVHKNNMAKLENREIEFMSDGKVVKPNNWQKPDLSFLTKEEETK